MVARNGYEDGAESLRLIEEDTRRLNLFEQRDRDRWARDGEFVTEVEVFIYTAPEDKPRLDSRDRRI